MHNVCNVHMPQAICDVISSISIDIGIGAAAADSIGYRAPARYQSNASNVCGGLHWVLMLDSRHRGRSAPLLGSLVESQWVILSCCA